MEYQLDLKQIVEFPRCRIYRDFIRSLVTNKGIRTNGSSFLFYYIVLCSYANYRSSYRRTETMTYLVGPGEWICTLANLRTWFRCRFQHQAVSILEYLQKQNYITYSLLENKKVVKFKITDWPKDNTVLEYNFPCKKDDGFLFSRLLKFMNSSAWASARKWTCFWICGSMPSITIRLCKAPIPVRLCITATTPAIQ